MLIINFHKFLFEYISKVSLVRFMALGKVYTTGTGPTQPDLSFNCLIIHIICSTYLVQCPTRSSETSYFRTCTGTLHFQG